MYSVAPGNHPNVYVLTYSENLAAEELLIDDELHLNEGRDIYLLVDLSSMNNGLPEGFLDAVQRSFVVHPHTAHIAVYTTSMLLRTAAGMVTKVTRMNGKITTHSTYEEAYQQLLDLMPESIGSIGKGKQRR
jgi:hypothetical protein